MVKFKSTSTPICRHAGIISALALATLCLISSTTRATDRYWSCVTGDWSDTNPNSWAPGIEPTSSDNAYIYNGGTATISQANEVCNNLYLGDAGEEHSGTVQMNNGSSSARLSASNEYIGNSGMGTFTQSNGYNSLTKNLYLGYDTDSNGCYTLSGTGNLYTSTNEYIGYSGTGVFTQSGGMNTADYHYWTEYNRVGYVYLGYNTSGKGTYTLSGNGSLVAFCEYIGYSGSGEFIQSSGSNCISGSPSYLAGLHLGTNAGSRGTYTLSGTGSLYTYNEYIGDYGTAVFTQTGGTHAIEDVFRLGGSPGSRGTYSLSGTGLLSVSINEYWGTTGIEYIGAGGTGEFIQTGGTNSPQGGIQLSGTSIGNGIYHLNGGTLKVGSITKGSGTATFNFGGGTLQARRTMSCSLPMTLTGIGGNAKIDTNGYAITLSGSLAGIGGLNKLGNGVLTLAVTNTYSGPTTIAQGTLSLSSSGSVDSTSLIVVNSGGTFDVSAKSGGFVLANAQTLQGSGSILGKVIATTGSRIAPGNGVGTLTCNGNLTLNYGSKLDFELGSPAKSDEIAMSSYTLILNNQQFSDFSFTTKDGFVAGTYTLIAASSIQGNLDDNLSGTIGGLNAWISTSDGDLVLTVVPEPSTLALLGIGVISLLGYWQRQRKQRA